MASRQTSGTRAKDSDRDKTCQILDTALAEGQLSMTEHQQRVRAATSAATLGDLQQLVADLQTANAPVQLPTLKRRPQVRTTGWGMRAAVAGVLVVLGIAIGWGLYGNTPSPLNFTSDPGAKSDGIPAKVLTPPRQLHSLGGLDGLFEQMHQKFGDTKGYDLTVYPDYASLVRPDPNEPRRELRYYYSGGFDDPTASAADTDDRAVDLSKFDTKAIVGILRGAPETLGIKAEDVRNTYLIVRPSDDPATPDDVELSIYVSGEFGSGYIELAPDGQQKRINYPS